MTSKTAHVRSFSETQSMAKGTLNYTLRRMGEGGNRWVSICSHHQDYVISFGSRAACLTDNTKKPLCIVRSTPISGLVGHYSASMLNSTFSATLRIALLSLVNRKSATVTVHSLDSTVTYSWKRAPEQGQFHLISNHHHLATLTLRTKDCASLNFHTDLPVNPLLLLSIGFLVFN
ncbi:hypothetical protein DSO57_1034765 [Entomophthora muscae]|uniref:Uncharacterized protein n=1 Tax=Entomophthora muscae TaxID=34485 RepID=A0ACC2SCU1_9FUNG|nr:hypothetical protein DSO57_1034765 [Entomophthora muscae]